MSVYFVTGKLGSGKSLIAVGRIRDYLKEGRRVATNLDVCPDRLLPARSRVPIHRLPDKPRVQDLEDMGPGYEGDDYDESKFGLLVLDELGTWFNARNWNDKERGPVIDWFLHARKRGWNIFFLVQDVDAVDKQLKGALCEHVVYCNNLSRLPIPVIGRLIGARIPKMHMARVVYGENRQGVTVDRWWYKGADMYAAYDTRQVFRDDILRAGERIVDFRAAYSVLPAWHTRGRYLEKRRIHWPTMLPYLILLALILPGLWLRAKFQGRSPWDLARSEGVVTKRKPDNDEELAANALDVYRDTRFASVR